MTCPTPKAPAPSLTDRLVEATVHALELHGVYLGKTLGLYRALLSAGPMTAAALAAGTGIAERYAREWLEQQAVAGLLAVDDPAAAPDVRRYTLPAAHVGALADDEDPGHVAPLAEMVAGIAAALPRVAAAYRDGGGVPFEAYGTDLRNGQAGINKPGFLHDLGRTWLPAIPDLDQALRATDPPARVADLGCGAGWSTIGVAAAYPHAEVTGYDTDPASIADAEANARARGLDVGFRCRDAAALADDGPFDLVLILEALHDMARPVEALAACRRALAPRGSIVIADERVADRFTAPGDLIERMMYGWSITHCLPAAMADQPSAAIGTAIRPDVVRACAREAGLGEVEILPIEHELFRFYRLRRGPAASVGAPAGG